LRSILGEKKFVLQFFLKNQVISSSVNKINFNEEVGNKMFFSFSGNDNNEYGEWESEAVLSYFEKDKMNLKFLKKYKIPYKKERPGDFSFLIFKGEFHTLHFLITGLWNLINFEHDPNFSGHWLLNYGEKTKANQK
jgi:hypothetical protein